MWHGPLAIGLVSGGWRGNIDAHRRVAEHARLMQEHMGWVCATGFGERIFIGTVVGLLAGVMFAVVVARLLLRIFAQQDAQTGGPTGGGSAA